jgi:hypothetical protein
MRDAFIALGHHRLHGDHAFDGIANPRKVRGLSNGKQSGPRIGME